MQTILDLFNEFFTKSIDVRFLDDNEFKDYTVIKEWFKQAFERLEAIDNSNPSEALECLNRMLGYASLDENDFEKVSDDYNAIKLALVKVQEQEKENTKHKNLEEELGCPLEVVIRAVKYGIYIKNVDGEIVNFKCELYYKNPELGWYFLIINGYVPLTDYKIKFWLKKDKSE